VYVWHTVQHGLIGNTFSEHCIPSSVPEHAAQYSVADGNIDALHVADEVFDTDDED
jgi:hypothetical protein